MKISQKLLNELNDLISNTVLPKLDDKKSKIAVIFRTAKGLRDAIYKASEINERLVEKPYYGKIEESADEFLNEHWEDWKTDAGSWGLKNKSREEISFYQWLDYAGQLHDFTEYEKNSYDNDEILEYSNEVESDSGLWEGLKEWYEIQEAIAFYTLKNDLCFAILEKAKNLAVNEDIDGAKID